MKLKIKNFQAIEEAYLEFPEGKITVLTGESNNGKTAILRAIRALALNPQGSKHYIQHGKNKAEVTLTNNGETLTWERTKSTTNYKYKGEEFTKCSRQSSKDFCNLGLLIDDKNNLVNLSDEWSTIYPFYMSETELFKHFEDLFSIVDSAKVLDAMKGDETSCNRDKLLHQDRLNDIIEKRNKAEELVTRLGDLGKPELIKNVLNKKYGELEILRSKCKEVEKLNHLSNLEVPSKSFNTDCLSEMGKQLLELHKACSRFSQIPENLSVPSPTYFVWDFETLGKVKKAEFDYKQEKQKLENLAINQMDLEKTISELKEQWDKIDTCPLCGKDMK